MTRFAANLSMLYPDLDFLDRFAAAANDGLDAVEYLFPYTYHPADLRDRLDVHGLQQVLFNAPPGDWEAGERGIASLPGREREFREGINQAVDYASALNCTQLHVMAGLRDPSTPEAEQWSIYRERVAWATAQVENAGLSVLLEPINTRDMPGYLLNTQKQAHDLVQQIDADNLGVQLDLYHCQITEGDLTTTIRRTVGTGRVRHVQIAAVPDRHEPDHGEVAFAPLLIELDALGFAGAVGLEYRPAADTSTGLRRFLTTMQNQGVSR